MYLEALAMLPQYIYCYRDIDNPSALVMAYVLFMGGYQMIFGMNWLYHYLFLPEYLEISSFIAGMLGIAFFSDYLMFQVTKRSALSHCCIWADDSLRMAEEAAQDSVLGSEKPIPVKGLSMWSDKIPSDTALPSRQAIVKADHKQTRAKGLSIKTDSMQAEAIGSAVPEVELACLLNQHSPTHAFS